MATLIFRGDAQFASMEGSGNCVKIPYDEGGNMYAYVNEAGSLVVGDSPPIPPSTSPAVSETETKPKAKPKKK